MHGVLLETTNWEEVMPARRARRTAYLDGLRGFAAFLVYLGHHQLWAHGSTVASPILENAFGYNGQFYFACLPGVRLFFSGGHFAVSVFFVLSGFVLSAKPLALIHDGQYVKLGDSLASALFRRWLRLYIPVLGTTFLYMTMWHAFGFRAVPDPQGSYRDELWNWYIELKSFSFVFRSGGEPWLSYNFHAWSLPVEFRGSIVVFTSLMAFSRCTRTARLWCQVGLIVYFMYIADGWYCALFVAGMLLSDLENLAAERELPSFFSLLEPHKTTLSYAMLLSSIYLGGVPSETRDVNSLRASPGWYYLSFLKPQAVFDYKWFYLFWAATFLVAATPRLPWLKAFFELRINQYLGRISFGFYLVHGPVLWSLGDRIYAATGWTRDEHELNCPGWINRFPLPKLGPFGLELGYLLPHVVLLPITLWLAQIVTKLFDEPSVRITQWLYTRMLHVPAAPRL
jgi:peptidoglycan/LPS O-acetylase OafA/YrhL